MGSEKLLLKQRVSLERDAFVGLPPSYSKNFYHRCAMLLIQGEAGRLLDSDHAPLGIAIHKCPNLPQFSNRRYKSVMESSTGSPFSCLCLLSLTPSKINVLMFTEHPYDLSSSLPFCPTLVLYFYLPAARENIAAHSIVQYCLLIHQIIYTTQAETFKLDMHTFLWLAIHYVMISYINSLFVVLRCEASLRKPHICMCAHRTIYTLS